MSYECRLCARHFRRAEDVVGIFSDDGKAEEIAPKIMYLLSILVTEHDPCSKFICKNCHNCVKCFMGFASTSRTTNFQLLSRSISDPANSQFNKEVNKFLKTPIHRLWFKSEYNISKLYTTVDKFMQKTEDDPEPLNIPLFEEGPSIQQPCSSTNSLTNGGSNENNCVTTNGNSSNSSTLDEILPPNNSKKILSTFKSKLKAQINNRRSCKNVPSAVETTNNDHNYVANNNIQVKTNGINVNEDVICLDDEDDDIQFNNPPNISTFLNKSRIQIHRTLRSIHLDQNAPSTSSWSSTNDILTNDSAENMTVTPDIALPNDDSTTTLIQPKLPIYLLVPNVVHNEPTESSLVTPETGFHFLCSYDQTVDLTEMEEENQRQTPQSTLRGKRKIKKDVPKSVPPSKKKCTQSSNLLGTSQKTTNHPPQVSSTLNITERPIAMLPVSNRRPKRASTQRIKYLEHKALQDLDSLKLELKRIDLPLHQCPICEKYYETSERRETHEVIKHPSPPLSTDSSDDSYPNLENETGTGQQEFLVCLNLVRKESNELKATKRLAKRKNLMKGLAILGNEPGSYKCHYCPYKTKLTYIFWAHVSTNHNEPDSDSRTTAFCFICERTLSKRTKLLKHIDKCIEEHRDVATTSAPTIEKITCELCGKEMDSSNELEKHLHEHVAILKAISNSD